MTHTELYSGRMGQPHFLEETDSTHLSGHGLVSDAKTPGGLAPSQENGWGFSTQSRGEKKRLCWGAVKQLAPDHSQLCVSALGSGPGLPQEPAWLLCCYLVASSSGSLRSGCLHSHSDREQSGSGRPSVPPIGRAGGRGSLCFSPVNIPRVDTPVW